MGGWGFEEDDDRIEAVIRTGQTIKWGARRIATTKDSDEQKHRDKMFACWRKTVELELELGWEASPSVLTALEEVPEDIRVSEVAPAERAKRRAAHGQNYRTEPMVDVRTGHETFMRLTQEEYQRMQASSKWMLDTPPSYSDPGVYISSST